MRVLFDQATPVPIRSYLKGHEVRTAAQQGWDTLKNGDLLTVAEADGFEVLHRPTRTCAISRILRAAKSRSWFSANSSGQGCGLMFNSSCKRSTLLYPAAT
jgi:hypothetical protein